MHAPLNFKIELNKEFDYGQMNWQRIRIGFWFASKIFIFDLKAKSFYHFFPIALITMEKGKL